MNVPPPPRVGADAIGRVCLVTGGAGYLGRALVSRLLEAGCTVRTLDVRAPVGMSGVPHTTGDLRDFEGIAPVFEGVDTVFHTAAVISIVGEDLAPHRARRLSYGVNVVGTENVVRACLAKGVRTLIHTSSFNVALSGPVEGGDESLPYADDAIDLYSRTKIAAERAVVAANGPRLTTVSIRPGGIWGNGPGSMMLDAFVEQLGKGAFTATIGDGTAVLDNTHVENVVDAEVLAARAAREAPAKVGGKAYFVTDDERINGMEWFRPLVEGLGYRFPKLRLPAPPLLRVAHAAEVAYLLGGPEPTLTRRGIRNLTDGVHFSIEAARRDLGYEPRYRREHLALAVPALREKLAEVRR